MARMMNVTESKGAEESVIRHSQQYRRGLTLVEVMVAVAITVIMMAATALIFKAATEASGKAMAKNTIMQQVRAVTRQLETDFRGLRPDMPMAIIFQNDPQTKSDLQGRKFVVRADRIVFFANGDFQTPGFNTTGNIARIFYGQSADDRPATQDIAGPRRRILARRFKILTALTTEGLFPPNGSSWVGSSHNIFDSIPIERATLAFWKNENFINFGAYYFRTNLTDVNATASMVRRPHLAGVYNLGPDRMQRLYFLPDVADLKVEVWFEGFNGWFPNPTLVSQVNNLTGFNANPINLPFALYWNVRGAPATGVNIDFGDNGLPIDWRSDAELETISATNADFRVWPQALRFTFTLHDQNRRYFPEGKTFQYVVKLPER